ncbi:MAG: hypothetical protein KDG49_08035, partial [Geminicoccaceae bacterium]|nr:hypothetical protein [Geminicoccaceae bacterium]
FDERTRRPTNEPGMLQQLATARFHAFGQRPGGRSAAAKGEFADRTRAHLHRRPFHDRIIF